MYPSFGHRHRLVGRLAQVVYLLGKCIIYSDGRSLQLPTKVRDQLFQTLASLGSIESKSVAGEILLNGHVYQPLKDILINTRDAVSPLLDWEELQVSYVLEEEGGTLALVRIARAIVSTSNSSTDIGSLWMTK